MESATFQREYLLRLPLPLAQLYRRAHNAKDPRSRHDNVYYLFEALIKLAAIPAIAAYLSELKHGAKRVPKLDRLLAQLALPSLGQWLSILRELAKFFGERPDSPSLPLGKLWRQLNQQRSLQEAPGMVALYRRIKNGADGQPAGDESCSLLQLFESQVQYRNSVFGHGGPRFADFFEREMGPLLAPAMGEVLADGTLDVLGPRGSRLVFLSEIRIIGPDAVEVGLRELVGTESERVAPLLLTAAEAADLVPNVPAIIWPGRPTPLRLDPLLRYRENEAGDEVLFLNRDRNGKQVEYLSYVNGATQRDPAMAAELAKLLSQVTGHEITTDQLQALGELSLSETPSVESLLATDTEGSATRMGDYDILAEVGRGGMGVVYLARQLSLGRLVALKMLPADLAADEVSLARFQREIRALARCDHPNIVKVLAAGRMPDGQLYYAMEYVPGCDLEQVWRELSVRPQGAGDTGVHTSNTSALGNTTFAKAVLSASSKSRKEAEARYQRQSIQAHGGKEPAVSIAQLPLPPLPPLPSASDDPGGYVRAVVKIIRDAALGLQAVHEQHVIHRDIKPGNLMLSADGSRIVLMDFGLAKGQDASLTASRQGGLLGTMRYAAPEQLAATSLKVGPPADIRGLGVTLWEMLTRRRLFSEAGDERQLATMVHEVDVPRIREIDPGFDRDLEAIVARATERRAADRIQTAAALAEYLQLYLNGKPLPIRPPSSTELMRRWVGEHRSLVFSAAGGLALALAGVVLAFISITANNRKLERELYSTAIARAGLELSSNTDFDRAKGYLQQCPEYLRGWEWRYLNVALDGERSPLIGHTRGLWTADFSPDGRQVVTASLDGTVKIWDSATGSLLRSIPAEPDPILPGGLPADRLARFLAPLHMGLPHLPIMCAAYSPDGRLVASGSFAPYVTFDPVTPLQKSVDTVGEAGSLKSLDPFKAWSDLKRGELPTSDAGKSVNLFKAVTGLSNTIRIDPDRSRGVVTLWDSKTGEKLKSFDNQLGVMLALAFSPDGRYIASSTINPKHTFVVWDTNTPDAAQVVAGHNGAVHRLRYSKDGRYLASCDTLGVVKLWDPATLKEIRSINAHAAPVIDLAFSPDVKQFATASEDGKICVWDVETGNKIRELTGHMGSALGVCFSPDGQLLASAGYDKTVRVWDARTGKERITLRGHSDTVWSVAFSPDGQRLVSASFDNTARIWDTNAPAKSEDPGVFSLNGHSDRVNTVGFSDDGRLLASGSWDDDIRIWNGNTGEPLQTLKGHTGAVWGVAFSPHGAQLASASWDQTIKIWDTASGSELRTLRGHTQPVHSVAYNHDGTRLVSGGWDGRVKVWDPATGELIADCEDFIFPVLCVAFSPDGQWVASGGGDKIAKIWDAQTGRNVFKLSGHTAAICSVAFSPDGQRLVTAGWDKTIKIWDLRANVAGDRLLLTLKGHTDRVGAVAFSPDGARIVSGSEDKTVRTWNATSGEEILPSIHYAGPVWSIAISPDGKRVAAACWTRSGWVKTALLSP
jgi:WD40 repeat protein/serine/threonine protein kinase